MPAQVQQYSSPSVILLTQLVYVLFCWYTILFGWSLSGKTAVGQTCYLELACEALRAHCTLHTGGGGVLTVGGGSGELQPNTVSKSFSSHAASGIKGVKHILHTCELPGTACYSCPVLPYYLSKYRILYTGELLGQAHCSWPHTSPLSVIRNVLVLNHMLWYWSTKL